MRDESVLLLHGLGRTSASMSRLAAALAADGYRTLNLDYPSRARDLAALSDYVQTRVGDRGEVADGRLHVVTHSMGGLVARAWIGRHRPAALGRIVMLAPPNQGSQITDLIGGTRAYRAVFGPAGAQLGTRRDAVTAALLAVPLGCEVGIIAGTRSLDPAGWLALPRPNDGKVSVASTRLEGMADHLVLPVTHTFLMRAPVVIAATLDFLRDGRFSRASCRVSPAS